MDVLGRGVLLVCAALGFGFGCGSDDSAPDDLAGTTAGAVATDESGSVDSGGSANAQPTIEAVVDPAAACGADGSLLLRATLIGCVSPPPAPCTLPMPPRTYESSVVNCPSTDAEGPMRIEIPAAGRYAVQRVVIAADGTEAATCYASDEGSEIVVDDDDLVSRPTIAVTEAGGGCL